MEERIAERSISMDHTFIFDRERPQHCLYRPFIMGTKGGVSTNSYYATKAGLEILQRAGTRPTRPWLSPSSSV